MATPASAPLVLPFDLASLRMDQRRIYLRTLWNADVHPLAFVGIAHALGYTLDCHWDKAAGMPILAPLH